VLALVHRRAPSSSQGPAGQAACTASSRGKHCRPQAWYSKRRTKAQEPADQADQQFEDQAQQAHNYPVQALTDAGQIRTNTCSFKEAHAHRPTPAPPTEIETTGVLLMSGSGAWVFWNTRGHWDWLLELGLVTGEGCVDIGG
jgi:hypothetical protein